MEVTSSGSSTAVSGDIARHGVIWGKPSLMRYMHIYIHVPSANEGGSEIC